MRSSCLAIVAAFSLLALPACGGGGDDSNMPDAGGGGQIDGGGGGQIDGGGGGGSAMNLGVVCDQQTPCPNGEPCIPLEQGADQGICSLDCTGTQLGMVGPCANDYTGPGVAYCGLSDSMMTMNACAIGCGEQKGGDTTCPTGLTCKDIINGNGTPDLCAP